MDFEEKHILTRLIGRFFCKFLTGLENAFSTILDAESNYEKMYELYGEKIILKTAELFVEYGDWEGMGEIIWIDNVLILWVSVVNFLKCAEREKSVIYSKPPQSTMPTNLDLDLSVPHAITDSSTGLSY